jgi:spermidine/putrescine transport system ATP-binding protein
MTADVRLAGIAMRFGETQALRGIDLDIAAGGYLVLLGPSGCGKSTLLGILGGFLEPTEGRVLIDGRDVTGVPPARRPTTTVFQDYALFPHMTVADNVGFGLRMRGMDRGRRRARAEEMLAIVGLPGAGGRRPDALSGGQRQRVALARALAVEPDVLLLDEPLGALDLKLRRAMQDELKAIQTRVGTTFVHVTHDQEEAMAVADTVVVMNAGRIEDRGPPEQVYLRPRTLFSAGFMGDVNMLPATVWDLSPETAGLDTDFGALALPRAALADAGVGQAVTLLIRPEHFREAGAGAVALGSARVEDVAFFGTHVRAHARVGPARVVAHFPQGTTLAPGDEVRLSVDPARITALPGRPGP